MASEPERDRVITTARRLFAQLGYDGITMGMIADASGVDAQRIQDLVGSKQDLYLTILTELFDAQNARLAGPVSEFAAEGGDERFCRLVDALLDFALEHPELPALMSHRWLSDALDLRAIVDDRFSRPLARVLTRAMRPAVRADLDLEFTVWTLLWCIAGFVNFGITGESGRRPDLRDPRVVGRFRAYLHELIARMR